MSEYFLRTLFVHTPGTRLGLQGDAVIAKREGAPTKRLPLNAIDSLVVLSGVDISTQLMARCADDGRTVTLLSGFGKPRAVVLGAEAGRGSLRVAQYRAHLDAERRLHIARDIVEGKITQMAWCLRQWARSSGAEATAALRERAGEVERAIEALPIASTREALLGMEGSATRLYFSGLNYALRRVQWPGRARRPPTDPVNAALSFFYALARSAVHGGLHAAGLDPYAGFLHGDRSDQPSLCLDLLEEFRPTVDFLTVKLFNLGSLQDRHFTVELGGSCCLTDAGREIAMQAWHDWRTAQVQLRGVVGPVARAAIPCMQATRLAHAIRVCGPYRAHCQLVR